MSIFMKFEGPGTYLGEAQDAAHEGWIVCRSISYGSSRETKEKATGQERRRADIKLDDFTVSKETDAATLPLTEAMLTGVVFSKVWVDFTSAFTDTSGVPMRLNYYEVVVENAFICAYTTTGSPNEIPSESLKLNFEKMHLKYNRHNVSGKKINQDTFGWDVMLGKEI